MGFSTPTERFAHPTSRPDREFFRTRMAGTGHHIGMRSFFAALRATASPAADGELLDRFCQSRDELAFAELIRRHGPLVWGVCRRGLANLNDAEDAFQATFLILVRRVETARTHPALGAWLYHVARHTVHRRKRTFARHDARLGALTTEPPDRPTTDADARADVDVLLSRLPARLREAVVLCHLQGFSRAEAAKALGCPEGTLSANLAEALKRLRRRVHGADVGAVLAVAGSAVVPAGLAAATVRAAEVYLISSVGISSAVVSLTEGVLRMFWVKKCVTAVTVAAMGVGVAVGVGLTVRAVGPGDEPKPKPATPMPAPMPPPPVKGAEPRSSSQVHQDILMGQLKTFEARIASAESQKAEAQAAIEMIRKELARVANQNQVEVLVANDDNAYWGLGFASPKWSARRDIKRRFSITRPCIDT
jgi:RNA polymerase sigma factor (sigma-70 family)